MTISLFVSLQAGWGSQSGRNKESGLAWQPRCLLPSSDVRLATGWQLSITTQPQHKSLLFELRPASEPASRAPPNNGPAPGG